jgi:hypothetical protein
MCWIQDTKSHGLYQTQALSPMRDIHRENNKKKSFCVAKVSKSFSKALPGCNPL